MEIENPRIAPTPPEYKDWWKVFDDPVLTRLIHEAYEKNLQLHAAGVRVLEARAQLGIVIGQWYPQTQQVFGSVSQNEIGSGVGFGAFGGRAAGGTSAAGASATSSAAAVAVSGQPLIYKESQLGVTASWEIDFWGKFRRAIESAQMNLLSSVASYDAALVSLTADVASNYVSICTLYERLKIARENADSEKESLRIAKARYRAGATGERDVKEALSQLKATESTIPQLETNLRQTLNALAILLGQTPAQLDGQLMPPCAIPSVPAEVAVGIPVDLLRRRPDVLQAEYQAAAQSAQIGYAEADLYPAFSLTGVFEVIGTNIGTASLGDMFSWQNRLINFGPSFTWNIFNYGRIINNVRLQDARFQELVENYRSAVLQAQQEVENGLVAFLNAQEQTALLRESVAAAKRSVDLAVFQYREGEVDYTTVLTAQQNLLSRQDQLASTQGQIPQSLISVYRALGGGWEIRLGHDFVPAKLREEMTERTCWDGLLERKTLPSPVKGPGILPPPPEW